MVSIPELVVCNVAMCVWALTVIPLILFTSIPFLKPDMKPVTYLLIHGVRYASAQATIQYHKTVQNTYREDL